MVETLIASLIIGISIAAIPGPIIFELVKRTLKQGFFSGAQLSAGDFIGNIILMTVIFFGVSNFLTNPFYSTFLFLVGGIILGWLGISGIRTKEKFVKKGYESQIKVNRSILVGMGMSISSPIGIAFWVSISGSYLSQIPSLSGAFLHILFIALGFTCFHFPLMTFVRHARKKISTKTVVLLSRIFGSVLLVYALFFFYQFFLSL